MVELSIEGEGLSPKTSLQNQNCTTSGCNTVRSPQARGTGAVPHWRTRGRSSWKQNGFEVFAVAENGFLERNANNLESCFIPHFIILLGSTSLYNVNYVSVRVFFNDNRSFL